MIDASQFRYGGRNARRADFAGEPAILDTAADQN